MKKMCKDYKTTKIEKPFQLWKKKEFSKKRPKKVDIQRQPMFGIYLKAKS